MQTHDLDVENRLNCLESQQLIELLDFILPNRNFRKSLESPIDSVHDVESTAKH
jgi:hypothetical protein